MNLSSQSIMQAILFVLMATLQRISSTRTVIARSDVASSTVELDTNVRLSCKTEMPWIFCLWHSPLDDKQCAIRITEPKTVCDINERVQLEGGKNFCDVSLNVTVSDHGKWMCLVNDAKEFNTEKKYVALSVVIPATLSWDQDTSDDTMELYDGETTKLGCTAKNGYPAPKFTWTSPKKINESNRLKISPETKVTTVPSVHYVSGHSSAMYEAKMEDSNLTISCIMVQSLNGVIYHTKTRSIKLKIKARIAAVGGTLTKNVLNEVGVISVLLVSILFIILLCVLFMKLGHRRAKQANAEADLQEEPLWQESKMYNEVNNEVNSSNIPHPHDSQVILEHDKAVVYKASKSNRTCFDVNYEHSRGNPMQNALLMEIKKKGQEGLRKVPEQGENCVNGENDPPKHNAVCSKFSDNNHRDIHNALIEEIKQKQKQKGIMEIDESADIIIEKKESQNNFTQHESYNMLLTELKQVQSKKIQGKNNNHIKMKSNKIDSFPNPSSRNIQQALIEELKERQKRDNSNFEYGGEENCFDQEDEMLLQHEDDSQKIRPDAAALGIYQQQAPILSRSVSTSDISSSSSRQNSHSIFETQFPTSDATISSYPTTAVSEPDAMDAERGRRSSGAFVSRTLVNPTVFPPPHTTKSLVLLPENKSHNHSRKRRKTGPEEGSSHSVFACDEGCFDVHPNNESIQQLVTVQTGALIL